MNSPRVVLSLVAIAAFATCQASAQASRTWVSGVGDDANPCSRIAPCKTWAGAISKTAPGGEIDALDPGGFGALTITKAITLDGGGGQVASVLVAGTNGINVSAGATDIVTIRNIDIQGIRQSGTGGVNGIQLNSAAALHIEHCAIMNFTQNGINIAPTAAAQVFIDDTVSRDNLGNGLNVQGMGTATIRVNVFNSRFLNNNNGVVVADYGEVTVSKSESSGNTAAGFEANGAHHTALLNLVDSTAANNIGNGAEAGGGSVTSTIRASNVSLFNNRNGFIVTANGQIETFSNNASDGAAVTSTKVALQ